jgi:primosomal protein N' (replication factor Y)
LPIVQKLLAKKQIVLQEEIKESYKPKQVKYVRLHSKFLSDDGLNTLLADLKNAKKQKDLVLQYFQLQASQRKPISVKMLCETSDSSTVSLNSLIEKEIFESYFLEENRLKFKEIDGKNAFTLSDAQQKAHDDIEVSFKQKPVCLLHGITASGKTEVYFKLIEKYLEAQKQLLILVPEIVLTTQLLDRFRAYFGNIVSVYHAKHSHNERVEVWLQVLENSEKAKIIIGSRSALFLPFSNLGLIIIDEEHEQNFKQTDPAPRYHARDAAIVLANLQGAKVLLGSATPSIESYFNAQSGKYGLVCLNEKFGKTSKPEIDLIDLKDRYFRKKMTGHFSADLITAITNSLSLGEQVILFQNRRGFSPLLECISCGHVPQCQQCDVSLTYHKHKNQLRCHYCGYAIAKPTHCHVCSSVDLSTKGFGTEQIELELNQIFPTAKTARMDQDTTRGKYGLEKILDAFKNKEIDLLVGTQMLAKGLDFENIGLVGIMNADSMLHHPDFRAFERSFQMMTQVSGRAGRIEKQGKVLIQTYNPNHSIIQQVVDANYKGMFEAQLYERKIYFYPPYFRIIKITLKHKDYGKLGEGAIWFCQVLRNQFSIPILGPEEPPINRIRNEYIRTILVKIPQTASMTKTKGVIQKAIKSFEAVAHFKAIKLIVTVDP